MPVDGVLAQRRPLRDVGVAQSLRDELEHGHVRKGTERGMMDVATASKAVAPTAVSRAAP